MLYKISLCTLSEVSKSFFQIRHELLKYLFIVQGFQTSDRQRYCFRFEDSHSLGVLDWERTKGSEDPTVRWCVWFVNGKFSQTPRTLGCLSTCKNVNDRKVRRVLRWGFEDDDVNRIFDNLKET